MHLFISKNFRSINEFCWRISNYALNNRFGLSFLADRSDQYIAEFLIDLVIYFII